MPPTNIPTVGRGKKRKTMSRSAKAKEWGFQGFISLCGFILPPLGILVHFGVGKDLLISIILTICGYFPSHIHAFYVHNVRRNSTRGRTPKWAVRYGLIVHPENKKAGWRSQYQQHVPGLRPHLDVRDSESPYTDPSAPSPSTRRRANATWAGGDHVEDFYGDNDNTRSRNSLYARGSSASSPSLPRSRSAGPVDEPFDPAADHDWAATGTMDQDEPRQRRKSFGIFKRHKHREPEPEDPMGGGYGKADRFERVRRDSEAAAMGTEGKKGRKKKNRVESDSMYEYQKGAGLGVAGLGERGELEDWDLGSRGGRSGSTDPYERDLPAPPRQYGPRAGDGLDHTF